MRILSSIIIISFLVTGCHKLNKEDKNELITYNISDLSKISNVKLSDLGVVDIKYIPLETNEISLISRITGVKAASNFFLIQYFTEILKFDYDGSFVTKIGSKGRGPDEFLVVHDLDIDPRNQNIYLVDGWLRKFYIFSRDGEFKRTFPSPLNTTSFKVSDGKVLCYSINSFENIEDSYNYIDTCGVTIRNYPNIYPWDLIQESTTILTENLFYRYNNKLYKKEIYSDTVFLFENMVFQPHIVLLHDTKLLTPKARSVSTSEEILRDYITQKNLFEFGDYLFYEFLFDFRIGGNYLLYGFLGSKKGNYQALINSDQGLINDIDGGPNFWPVTSMDDNTIVGWVDALKIKEHNSSEVFKNSKPIYPEKKKEFENLANSLKETDNPVLIVAKLKE